jgi:hypothetical protein
VLAADMKLDLNLIKASVILNEKAAHLLPDEDSDKVEYRAREQSRNDWAVLQEATRRLDKAADDAYRALPDEADSYRLGNAVLVQLDLKGRTHELRRVSAPTRRSFSARSVSTPNLVRQSATQ